MEITAGQLAILAAKEITKRLFKAPGSTISQSEIATVVRQTVIGGDGYVITAPAGSAAADSDEMLLVMRHCTELLARADGLEVTFTVAPDRSRSVSVRRTNADVREKVVIRALDEAGGGLVTAPIAASSLARGHLELFVLPAGMTLRHRWFWPDPNWSEWGDMDLPVGRATAIAAGSKDEYAQEVAVAVGDVVYNRWWTGEDWGWSHWDVMPRLGTPVIDLAFSSNIADALEIYALDAEGRIRHRWWRRDRGWSRDWTPMDTPHGRRVTAIAAGSYADYHQELFAIVDGEIWHRWWWRNDGWSSWRQQAAVGRYAAGIAVSTLKEGHIEVFALSHAGQLRHRWYWAGHGWSGWQDFPVPGGSRLIAITAASNSPRHQEIFGLKSSGEIVHTWNWLHDDGKPDWDSWSEWSTWHQMPPIS